jgi:hypothetical protein
MKRYNLVLVVIVVFLMSGFAFAGEKPSTAQECATMTDDIVRGDGFKLLQDVQFVGRVAICVGGGIGGSYSTVSKYKGRDFSFCCPSSSAKKKCEKNHGECWRCWGGFLR